MNETLAQMVLRLRNARGWTQDDLASRADLNQPTVADIERGRSKLPGPEIRRRLASVLGIRHIDLLVAAGQITEEEIADVAPRWPTSDKERIELYQKIADLEPDDLWHITWTVDRALEAARSRRRPRNSP